MRTIEQIEKLIRDEVQVDVKPQLLLMLYRELGELRKDIKNLQHSLSRALPNKYDV